MNKYTRNIVRAAFILTAVFSSIYLFSNRYYLRIIPLTPSALAWLDNAFPGTISSTLSIISEKKLPFFDLTQETGVDAALAYVRNFSPLVATNGQITYLNITVNSWMVNMRSNYIWWMANPQL
jgi:hypothetical protein